MIIIIIIIISLKIYKNFCNLVKSFCVITASKPNFYYIIYDININIYIYITKDISYF